MYRKALILNVIFAFAATLFLVSAGEARADGGITADDVSQVGDWGQAKNVTNLKHLYFSGQPDEATLATASENGVTTVINLREPSEMSWDEQAAVEAAGMKYINIPVVRGQEFDAATMSAITEAVQAQDGEPVLLHCGSGLRATAWLAIHMVDDHGSSQENAFEVAEAAGLTSEGMKQRAAEYLENE